MSNSTKFNQDRTFGIEIEFFCPSMYAMQQALTEAGVNTRSEGYHHETRPYWKLVSDASLRGMRMDSCELVSPVLKGTEGLAEVKKAMKVLLANGAKVNTSCGLHVHWNVRDYTGADVKDLLTLYIKFEEVIDSLVAPSRRGDVNEYSYSLRRLGHEWVNRLGHDSETATSIAEGFTNGNRDRYTSTRYRKVNLASYFMYKTIEFRQHQGTVDWEKALNWIVFTQALVEKAKRTNVKHTDSKKSTLGELFRILGMTDHQTDDPTVIVMREFMKKRFTFFKANGANEGN